MTGYPTSIGSSDESSIRVLGQDLAQDLMGQVGFGELAFWLVAMRRPEPGELRVFEAVLVALADHGLTPSAIAARLTLTGAPESVQGALAAGLLGGGSRFLGVTEDAGRFLAAALDRARADGGALPDTDEGWDDLARDAVGRQRAAGLLVPGLGHNVHKAGDPRTPVLFQIAADEGVLGRTCGCSRPSAGCTPRCSAAPCRSTVPVPVALPCATSASRSRSCVASRCWPGPPACSGTWPRRCAARSAWTSTSRSTGPPTTCRRARKAEALDPFGCALLRGACDAPRESHDPVATTGLI